MASVSVWVVESSLSGKLRSGGVNRHGLTKKLRYGVPSRTRGGKLVSGNSYFTPRMDTRIAEPAVGLKWHLIGVNDL
ncbi:hypothetical protein KIN20_017035 [Parelaphostrongylus tenuis]|uniref:Uncharacterized protein n=1 Tax=Parelaphostrongylus tenuis TaxID=148309 RepID=A0AAD5QR64_PARTN|nr:hypothetical protein KIN20_017035 [Parelaphostrongylus tenuis]